ncbi:MAG: hypothetical protein QM775_09285 [Pirellulales bacterium]
MNGLVANFRLGWWRRNVLPGAKLREQELAGLDDAALTKQARSWGYRLKSGEPLKKLTPEALALVREAVRRVLGLGLYDVQLLGGLSLLRRAIVEMQTGEGKTLTAIFPTFVRAAAGKGIHVATANDYLAARDAEHLRPIYGLLGLSVGVVTAATAPGERRAAYQCDVTYGTAKEFGFDFLRDRLSARRRKSGGTPARRTTRAARIGDRPRPTMIVRCSVPRSPSCSTKRIVCCSTKPALRW